MGSETTRYVSSHLELRCDGVIVPGMMGCGHGASPTGDVARVTKVCHGLGLESSLREG